MLWHVKQTNTNEFLEIRGLLSIRRRERDELDPATLEAGVNSGALLLLALGEPGAGWPVHGYALCVPSAQALAVVDVFVVPDARGKGYFREFVQWLERYREVTGVTVITTVVRSAAEYAPWARMGAESVAMSLDLSAVRYEPRVPSSAFQARRPETQSERGGTDGHVSGHRPGRDELAPVPGQSLGADPGSPNGGSRGDAGTAGKARQPRVRHRAKRAGGPAPLPAPPEPSGGKDL